MAHRFSIHGSFGQTPPLMGRLFHFTPILLLVFWRSLPPSLLAGDLYLLAVGVGAYDDSRIPSLQFVEDDVSGMTAWAESQKQHYFHKIHVKALVDDSATRRNILDALLQVFQSTQNDDLVVLFLAGHGVLDPVSRAWHFLPVDADLDSIAGTGLEQDDLLKKLMSGIRTQPRVLGLIDACQSGGISSSVLNSGGLVPARSSNGTTSSRLVLPSSSSSSNRGVKVVQEQPYLTQQQVHDRSRLFAIYSAGLIEDSALESSDY